MRPPPTTPTSSDGREDDGQDEADAGALAGAPGTELVLLDLAGLVDDEDADRSERLLGRRGLSLQGLGRCIRGGLVGEDAEDQLVVCHDIPFRVPAVRRAVGRLGPARIGPIRSRRPGLGLGLRGRVLVVLPGIPCGRTLASTCSSKRAGSVSVPDHQDSLPRPAPPPNRRRRLGAGSFVTIGSPGPSTTD